MIKHKASLTYRNSPNREMTVWYDEEDEHIELRIDSDITEIRASLGVEDVEALICIIDRLAASSPTLANISVADSGVRYEAQ